MGKMPIVIIGLLLSAGCGAPPRAFQNVRPGAGHAIVYVYRPSQNAAGSDEGLGIFCDRLKVAALKPGGYIYIEVPVGYHAISSTTEATVQVSLDAREGRSYFIEVATEPGFSVARPRLKIVPEEQGRIEIVNTKYFGP